MPFFCDREIGAVTTDNRAIVTGGAATREWYDLRYAQRHMLMSSMALSRRVLVLTGRYSVIRADLATHPSFIEQVENDAVTHWRFGRFKFLSGDDKSTWHWLIGRGWKMLYLPDVQVHGFEALPDPDRFVASSIDLMQRWYGNMLRISGRAIALGPRPMGLFTWWALIDQRLSMWTSLIGPTVAILMTVFVRPSFLLAYILWIMATRLVAALILGVQRGRFSFLWPPLLYYGQICGAGLKTYISYRYNRQKWSRQGISSGEPQNPFKARWQRRVSTAMHATGLLTFVFMVTLGLGILPPPALTMLPGIARDIDRGVEQGDWWIGPALAAAPEGAAVRLPAGAYTLTAAALTDAQARTGRRGDTRHLLIGAGVEVTSLRLDRMLSARTAGPSHPARTTGAGAAGGTVLHCGTGPAACRLALPTGGGVTIADLRLALDTAATAKTLPGRRLQFALPADAQTMISAR
jgi:glycosyltransferase Alg8